MCNNSPAKSTSPENGWRLSARPIPGGRSETLGASSGGMTVGADLGCSSKYSNENFEGRRGERFHVNGTCTWPAHPGNSLAGGRVQRLVEHRMSPGVLQGKSAKWIRNFGKRIGSEGWARGSQSRTRRLPVDCLSCSCGNSGLPRASWGTDWERLLHGPSPGVEQSTQNCALNVKVKKVNQVWVKGGSNYDSLKRNHSQGNGLGRISGERSPVEFDSSPTL
ncbi:hypothetical protein AgCh_033901 [Apium graveolens]